MFHELLIVCCVPLWIYSPFYITVVNHVCAYGCVVADHLSIVLTTVFP